MSQAGSTNETIVTEVECAYTQAMYCYASTLYDSRFTRKHPMEVK